jgi:DNA-binding beta-propeller fold protein YncE
MLLAWYLLVPVLALGDDKDAPVLPKVHKIAVGGEGGWDYLTVDSAAHRLYVSRGNRVVVIDLESEKVVGELPDTPGIHGMALVPELGKGYTSNGGDSSVTVFDLKTLKAIRRIEARGVPDAILYDAVSKRVFTFNHSTDDVTAIDTIEDTVAGTIALEAEPEAAVADGQGHIFVNLRSTSEIGEFDAKSLKILNRWPLAPGVRPNGLGFDAKNRRLFSTCGNQKMVVMDADSGNVLGTAEIGQGSDGCVFDSRKGLAYSSNGEGNITAVRETEPGKFSAIMTIPTQPGARTMALDPKTHRLYLSAATIAPDPAGQTQTQGRGRRNFVPGSFVILVIGD